jgi:hypothetical protein
MKHDGITLAAMIVLASFVVERVKAGILFVLAGSARWQRTFRESPELKDEALRAAQRKQKAVEFFLAGALVLVALLMFPQLRVFEALGLSPNGPLDFALTWLILTTGSDKLGEFLNGGRELAKPEPAPVKIVGDVRLIETEPAKSEQIHELPRAAGQSR